MRKIILLLSSIFLIGCIPLIKAPESPPPKEEVFQNELIKLQTPLQNQLVKSPLKLKGEARGPMYWEATFAVAVLDADKKELGRGPIMTSENWMTEDFSSFEGEVKFTNPTTKTGFLVLEKSNASGLPEKEEKFYVPIRYE